MEVLLHQGSIIGKPYHLERNYSPFFSTPSLQSIQFKLLLMLDKFISFVGFVFL